MKKVMQIGLAVAVIATIVGCQSVLPTGRTNHQEIIVRDQSDLLVDQSVRAAAFMLPTVPIGGWDTNAYAQIQQLVKIIKEEEVTAKSQRESSQMYGGDVFTQNQMIETGRDEANSTTATSVPQVTPTVNTAWGAGSVGTPSEGTTDSLYMQFKKWISGTNTTGKTTSTTTAESTGTSCTTGQCSDAVK